jgi:hypothetical protein
MTMEDKCGTRCDMPLHGTTEMNTARFYRVIE